MPISLSGSLNLSGSLTTTGTITATTLVVQTITSSISSITGSTNFGSLSSNNHLFTGSMFVTGAFYVTTGSVGIGTTSPSQKVEIQAGANQWATRFVGANVASQSYGFYVDAGTNATDTNAMFRSNGGSSVYMYIGGDGKVGVGNTTPGAKLHVFGATLDSEQIRVSNSNGGGYWGIGRENNITGDLYFNSGGSVKVIFANNGLVNINNVIASSSTYKLGVSGSAYINGSNGKGIFISDQATYATIVGLNNAISTYNGLELRASGTDYQLYLTTGGQVNVGSSQTTYPFYVQAALGNWTAVFENTTSGASGILMRSTGGSQGYYYGAYDGGAYKFFVNGSGVVNSTSTSITIISSDIKLKTDIRDYDKGLAEVLAMKPRIYKRKDNLEVDEVGFIAQEMDIALAGSMIESYKDENEEAVMTYQLEWYPLLVKAIQELTARVQYLENK